MKSYIVGGTEVDDFSKFAYQLSLRIATSHICGASIIAEFWALSGKFYFSVKLFDI